MPFFAFAGEPQRDTQQAARMGRLLGVLSQGTDDEVDQKIKRFLVQFKKVSSVPPVPVEVLEKFLRFEVAAQRAEVKSRAEQTEEQRV